jgi:hypothetical protein
MDYFLLSRDKRFFNSVQLEINKSQLAAEEPMVIYNEFQETSLFDDYYVLKILFDYFYILSDKFKTMLSAFEDNMKTVPLFLTSKDLKNQHVMWKTKIDGLSINANLNNIGKSEYDELIGLMGGRHIAKVTFEKQEFVIVSLTVAELALRKYIRGVCFTKIRPNPLRGMRA